MKKLKIAVMVAAFAAGWVACDDKPVETAPTQPPPPGMEVDRDVAVPLAGARVANEDLGIRAAAPEAARGVLHPPTDEATSVTSDTRHDSDETVDVAPRQLPRAAATANLLSDGR